MKVVFIGAGNLASNLSLAMRKAGINIVQVYSRTEENAQQLAQKLNCKWTTRIEELTPDADMYIFSVKDASLSGLLARMPLNNSLWIHTAGSLPLEIFKEYTRNYGVLYPLQTFSKDRNVDFSVIPFFIEANTPVNEKILQTTASALTTRVHVLSSEKRSTLHLAAVFACNFSNYMYALAGKLLEEQALPFEILLPLIDETARKVHELSPLKAQTGPAVRYDENIIRKHLDLLQDPQLKELYQLISKNIHKEMHP